MGELPEPSGVTGLPEPHVTGLPEPHVTGLPEQNVTGLTEPNRLGQQIGYLRGLQKPNITGLPESNGLGQQNGYPRGLQKPNGRGRPEANVRGLWSDPDGRGQKEPIGPGGTDQCVMKEGSIVERSVMKEWNIVEEELPPPKPPYLKLQVSIEAVENYMPQVMVIDEIGTKHEAMTMGYYLK
ncbi:hypothetical protein V8G54_036290, partial [Vigna mungo]